MPFEAPGTTIAFQSGYLAEITDSNLSGMSRERIETTTFATPAGSETYMPAKHHDPGTIDVTIQFDPSVNPNTIMSAATESVVITWADAGAAVWTVDMFATALSVAAPKGDRATANVSLAFADGIVVS